MVEQELINLAESILNENQNAVCRVETEIVNIGCTFCANCSGIVGG